MLMQLAMDRKRVLADASGALLLAILKVWRALEKDLGDARELEAANRATAHLYIANPQERKVMIFYDASADGRPYRRGMKV